MSEEVALAVGDIAYWQRRAQEAEAAADMLARQLDQDRTTAFARHDEQQAKLDDKTVRIGALTAICAALRAACQAELDFYAWHMAAVPSAVLSELPRRRAALHAQITAALGDDAGATLLAERDAMQAALLAFVEVYANVDGKPGDRVQVDLFSVWLRACGVLGIGAGPGRDNANE